jgi:DNA-binding transcriptional LysR family regulator
MPTTNLTPTTKNLPPFSTLGLELFRDATHTLCFTETGRNFGMPQPDVTKQIEALESALGEALFVRATRPPYLKLTEAGERLAPQASEILALCRKAVDQVRTGRQSPVCVAVNEAIQQTWLSQWRELTLADGLSCSFETVATAHQRYGAAQRWLDLCICTERIRPNDWRQAALPPMPMSFYGSAQHYGDRAYTLPELAQHCMVTFQKASIPAEQLEQLLNDNRLNPPRIQWLSSINEMIDSVLNSDAVAALPDAVVTRRGPQSGLQRLRCDKVLPPLQMFISVPKRQDAHLSAVLKTLLDFTERHLGKRPTFR